MALDFRRIRWVKSVTLEDDFAYCGEDPTVLAREPRGPGDLFELHATEDDEDTLGDPAVGDLVVLTQHDQATHVVEVVGERVEARPRRTMRPRSRDELFAFQRTCRCLVLLGFDEAPLIRHAFGFDPEAKGGDVLELASLPSLERAGTPLWMLQRRLERAMTGLLPPPPGEARGRRATRGSATSVDRAAVSPWATPARPGKLPRR
jgi:hypothetical protein